MNNNPLRASQEKISRSRDIAQRIQKDLDAARQASAALLKKKGLTAHQGREASGGGRLTLVIIVLLLVGVAWLATTR